MSVTDLSLRARPQQSRSQATMDRILQVSAELLEEVGPDGFNTNLLAQRAGVGVRAIYRYFPNKWSILVNMAERLHDLERAWVGDLKDVGSFPNWRSAVDRAIDGYFAAASKHTGYAALRAASHATPELREVEDRSNRELELDLATGLRALGVALPPRRLQAVCRTIIQSSNRILDIALQSERAEARLLLAELKRMIANLLADYVPETAPDAERAI